MFWVCPLSFQLCPLSVQTSPLSIHCWLCDKTFRKDSWLWPDTWSTESNCVHLQMYIICIYLVGQGLNILSLPTVHPALSTICPDMSDYCPSIVDYVQWNETFRKDPWLQPETWSEVTVYIYMYLPDWSSLNVLGLPTIHPGLSTVFPDMSTVHPLLTMKWDIQKRFLIMTWHMIHSNCVHLHIFTWLVKVWMFWVCPLSIQVCPLSFQICLLSIHCWIWNDTFRKDSWLWLYTVNFFDYLILTSLWQLFHNI